MALNPVHENHLGSKTTDSQIVLQIFWFRISKGGTLVLVLLNSFSGIFSCSTEVETIVLNCVCINLTEMKTNEPPISAFIVLKVNLKKTNDLIFCFSKWWFFFFFLLFKTIFFNWNIVHINIMLVSGVPHSDLTFAYVVKWSLW